MTNLNMIYKNYEMIIKMANELYLARFIIMYKVLDFLMRPLHFPRVIYELLTFKKCNIQILDKSHCAKMLINLSHLIHLGFLLISVLLSIFITNVFRYIYYWKYQSSVDLVLFRWEGFLILFSITYLFDNVVDMILQYEIIPT